MSTATLADRVALNQEIKVRLAEASGVYVAESGEEYAFKATDDLLKMTIQFEAEELLESLTVRIVRSTMTAIGTDDIDDAIDHAIIGDTAGRKTVLFATFE